VSEDGLELRRAPRQREDPQRAAAHRPEERIVSVQLFGPDPEVMRSAAEIVARRGADLIDLNMGCPVPKVCKTGAGAALIDDPDVAVAVAAPPSRGSGLPVTVKLRSGRTTGDTSGYALAHRLVDEAGVAAIGFHPRSASPPQGHARLRARRPPRRVPRRAGHPQRGLHTAEAVRSGLRADRRGRG